MITIYKIFAVDKKTGEEVKFSPPFINRDYDAMVKLALHIKIDMSNYYHKVILRADRYKYLESEFIKV